MHGQCDARPAVTFPTCAGTKFILLGDSWLSRILILWHLRLNSLDLTSRTGPDSNPGRYADQTSEYTTAVLSRQPDLQSVMLFLVSKVTYNVLMGQ